MIGRILRLPFYFIALIAAIFLPFLFFTLISKGSDNYFTALLVIGAYPMFLAMLHGAIIEHFILRKMITTPIARKYADDIAVSSPWWQQVVLYAHTYLLDLLQNQRSQLSPDVYSQGQSLAKRHRFLSILVYIGILLMFIGGLGDAYL